MVRCKFKCIEKAIMSYAYQQPGDAKQVRVKLVPCQGEPFGKYTPSGSMEMLILNDAASAEFEAGKEYYIDIQEVIPEPVCETVCEAEECK